jgi:hypothetical protein
MAAQLALMRGINVGGKNILPMKELAIMFEAAGCAKVRTFIQSGNVIFTAAPKVCEGLSRAIAAQVVKKYGFRTPVILRTAQQLRHAVAGNPFPGEEDRLHLMFLQDKPSAGSVAGLDAQPVSAGPLPRARRGNLSPSAQRRGPIETHQRLVRFAIIHREYAAELADGDEASRSDGGLARATAAALRAAQRDRHPKLPNVPRYRRAFSAARDSG